MNVLKITYNILFLFQITIQNIQADTSMHPQDIALTFMLLGFIRKSMSNKFLLALDWAKVDQHMQRVAKSLQQKTRINLDPDRLRWTPMLSSPLSLFAGSPFKSNTLDPVEDPETPEKPTETPSPDKSKARQNLASALKSSEKKDGKKSTINNISPSKKGAPKKGKNRVRARTRGASSTATTTTTDDTSDEEEAEEDVSHVTPRKKRGKNNQDSINSDDEDQNNVQGTAGKKGGNKRASSRGKNTTGKDSTSKKDDNSKSSQNSKGKKNTAMAETSKRTGKQRGNKMFNQSGECLGMDGGTNININKNRKQKYFKKKQFMINYHLQEDAKRRKLFLNNDNDSDDDDYEFKSNENNGYEFESSNTGIRTQSRFSPNGDSSSKTLFNRGCIGDLLYHKKPSSNNKKNTSPKVCCTVN